jgi:tetratricopeptide repeat protein
MTLRCSGKSGLCLAVTLVLGWTTAPIWSSQSAAGQAGDPAAALFNAAEAVRTAGRADEAISKYQRIMAEYPSSPWAARSALEAARSMVGQGKWEPAMRQMEIVRLGFKGTPEAEQALERNTILHRLRLRQGQPVYRFARTAVDGRALLRRVINVDMDSKGRVYIATRQSSVVLNESGGIVSTEPANDLRGVAMHGDVPIWFYERGTREGTNTLVPIAISDQNRQREPDIQAGAVVSGEAMLIADRRSKAVHRVSMSGGYQSRLALVDAARIAVGPMGEAATIERETGALLLIAPDGKTRPIPATGPGYMFRAPIDLAFDPLGHLYVLERDSVVIFSPTGEFLSVFAPGSAAGAFRTAAAFHVDGAGRLYVYDEDSERLQVFQ